MAFSYTFLGKDPNTTLRVEAITEGKFTRVLVDVRQGISLDFLDWSQHYVSLPPGLHMLGIVGQRGTQLESGIALDDIRVDECTKVKGMRV